MTMDSAYYRQMYELEDGHWWFVSRRELASRLLVNALGAQTTPHILDLGCGTGGILDTLARIGPTTGVDVEGLALDFCRERGHTNVVEASAVRLPFPAESFDAVVALDVFEHIEDDQMAMNEAFRVLRPGGVGVVTVPAYAWLWSQHDVALHHHRRYSQSMLLNRLETAGFIVRHHTYTVSSILPVAWFIRRILGPLRGSGKPISDIHHTPSWLNSLLIALLHCENQCAACCRIPFGVTVVAVVEKPL